MKQLQTLTATFLSCMAISFAQYGGFGAKSKKVLCNMRILFALLLSICFSIIYAEPVTEQQALQKAQKFFKDKRLQTKNVRRASRAGQQQSTAKEDFYIFNVEDNGGFVIVSGDDRTEEILGYSDNGRIDIDSLPDNLRSWLEGYAKQIKSLGNIQTTSHLLRDAKPKVEPLIKSQWGENSFGNAPFSWMLPEKDGKKCVPGCVAIAMAQVMNYHKWPQTETKGISAYTTGSGIYMPELPPICFNWNQILSNYTYLVEGEWGWSPGGRVSYSEEEGNAVSQLMLYCGQAARLNYGVSGTGGGVNSKIMAYYFGYDRNARDISRHSYSNSEWEEIIYNEISSQRPVLYNGQSGQGGAHMFVCDGYDGAGYFHINWGFSGRNDGYFRLSILDDSGEEIHSRGFTMSQGAMIGLQPGDGSEVPEDYVIQRGWGVGGSVNRSSSTEDFELHFHTRFYLTNVIDRNQEILYGERALAFIQPDGSYKYIIAESEGQDEENDYTLWKATFGANWGNGTYKCWICYRIDSNKEWEMLEGTHILINIEDAKVTMGLGSEKEESYIVNDVSFLSPLVEGRRSICKVNVTNTGETSSFGVYLFVNGLRQFRATALIDPGETSDILINYTPNTSGIIDLKIYSNYGGNYCKYTGEFNVFPKDSLDLEDVEIHLNEEMPMVFSFISDDVSYKSVECNIELPEGLSFSDDNPNITKKPDGTYHFSSSIPDNNSNIGELMLRINGIIEGGNYTAKVYDVECVKASGESVFLCPSDANILVYYDPIIVETIGGDLEEKLPENKYCIDNLTIKGKLSGSDLKFLRDLAGVNMWGFRTTNGRLRVLDMSDVQFVASNEEYVYNNANILTPLSISKPENFPNRAFENCVIESIILPRTVSSIGGLAFCRSNLKSITIPNSVNNIGMSAFGNCKKLTEVYCYVKSVPKTTGNIFDGSNLDNATLYVPAGSKASYEVAEHWKEFKEIVEMCEKGDVNGDGVLDASDVVGVVNLMAGQQPEGLDASAADTNGDTLFNIADIIQIVNQILNKE